MNWIDQVLFYSVEFLIVGFLLSCVFRGLTRKYVFVLWYASGILIADALRLVVLRAYGIKSDQFFNAFYGAEFCLVVLKYLAILSLFDVILRDSPLRAQARLAFLLFFALVAAMSYAFISQGASTQFYRRLIVEFEQNIHFASVVLAALLYVTLTQLRVADPRLRMLVTGLGISGALQASVWALHNLAPSSFAFVRYLNPLAACLQFALWCYSVNLVPSLADVQAMEPAPENRMRQFELAPQLTHAGARG